MIRNTVHIWLLALLLCVGCAVKTTHPDIFAAIKAGDIEDVKRFIKKGTNLETLQPGTAFTPLIVAVDQNKPQVVELLIEHHAVIEAKDQAGLTPLNRAAYNNDPEMIRLLIKHKAEVNDGDSRGRQPIHWATMRNARDALDALLAAGADINATDGWGVTPLKMATDAKNITLMDYLKQHGAKDSTAVATP